METFANQGASTHRWQKQVLLHRFDVGCPVNSPLLTRHHMGYVFLLMSRISTLSFIFVCSSVTQPPLLRFAFVRHRLALSGLQSFHIPSLGGPLCFLVFLLPLLLLHFALDLQPFCCQATRTKETSVGQGPLERGRCFSSSLSTLSRAPSCPLSFVPG